MFYRAVLVSLVLLLSSLDTWSFTRKPKIDPQVTSLEDSIRVLHDTLTKVRESLETSKTSAEFYINVENDNDSLIKELGVVSVSLDSLKKKVRKLAIYEEAYSAVRKNVVMLKNLGVAPFMKISDPSSLDAVQKNKLKVFIAKLPITSYLREYFIWQLDNQQPHAGFLSRGELVDIMGFRNGGYLGLTYINTEEEQNEAMVFDSVEIYGRFYQFLIPLACGNPTIRIIVKSERVEVPVPVIQIRDVVTVDTVKIPFPYKVTTIVRDTFIVGQGVRPIAAIWGLYGHPFPNRTYLGGWHNTTMGGEFALMIARKHGGFSKPHFGPSVLVNAYHYKAATNNERTDFLGFGLNGSVGLKAVFPSKQVVASLAVYAGVQGDWNWNTRPQKDKYRYDDHQYTIPTISEGFTITAINNNCDVEYALYGTQGIVKTSLTEKAVIYNGDTIGQTPNSKLSAGQAVKIFWAKKRVREIEFQDGLTRPITQDNKINPGLIFQHNAMWLDWSEASKKDGVYMVTAFAAGPGVRFPRIPLNLYLEGGYTLGYEDRRSDGFSVMLMAELGLRW